MRGRAERVVDRIADLRTAICTLRVTQRHDARFRRRASAATLRAVMDTHTVLLTEVCQALMSAGFDVSATDPTRPGLYVTQDDSGVRIRWTPTPEVMAPSILHTGHGTARLSGMRDAVHAALTTTLVAMGFTLADTTAPNTLRITAHPLHTGAPHERPERADGAREGARHNIEELFDPHLDAAAPQTDHGCIE